MTILLIIVSTQESVSTEHVNLSANADPIEVNKLLNSVAII